MNVTDLNEGVNLTFAETDRQTDIQTDRDTDRQRHKQTDTHNTHR